MSQYHEDTDSIAFETSSEGTAAIQVGSAAPRMRQPPASLDEMVLGYKIRHLSPVIDEWENGEGVFDFDAGTIQRTTITASSNGGAIVSLSAGLKLVEIVVLGKDIAYFGTALQPADVATSVVSDGGLFDTTHDQKYVLLTSTAIVPVSGVAASLLNKSGLTKLALPQSGDVIVGGERKAGIAIPDLRTASVVGDGADVWGTGNVDDGVTALIDAAFDEGDDIPAEATFTRATVAWTLDHEGILRKCKSGELRRRGLRRVENLFPSSDTPATQAPTVVVGARYTLYFRDGGGTGSFAVTGAATATVDEGEALSFTAATTTLTCTFSGSAGATATVQLEENSGSATDAPSEYVDSATTYNAGVAAVKYFATTNGNTFAGTPGPAAPTEATSTTLVAAATRRGIVLERAATNLVAYSFDMTTGWTAVATGTRSTSGQVGLDGRVGGATLLTDTSAVAGEAYGVQANQTGLTAGLQYVYWIICPKDEDETRFPELRIYTASDGTGALRLNTSSGARLLKYTGAYDYHFTIDLGTDWLWGGAFTPAGTNMNLYVFAAAAETISGGFGTSTATGSLLVKHAQCELGSLPSLPIVTSGSAGARNADALALTEWPSAWLMRARGRVDALLNGLDRTILGSDDADERIWIDSSGVVSIGHGTETAPANGVIVADGDPVSEGAEFIIRAAYDGTDYYIGLDDEDLVSDTSDGDLAGPVEIGSLDDDTAALNGTVASLTIEGIA